MKTELQEQVSEENETPQQAQKQTAQEEVYSSKQEAILAKLYADGIEYITKAELKDLGLCGFFLQTHRERGKIRQLRAEKSSQRKSFPIEYKAQNFKSWLLIVSSLINLKTIFN